MVAGDLSEFKIAMRTHPSDDKVMDIRTRLPVASPVPLSSFHVGSSSTGLHTWDPKTFFVEDTI